MADDRIHRLAELVVALGANVQPDQIVNVVGGPGKEELTRAVAAAAYRRGARFVDVTWFDPYVKRARVAHAREETLEFVPHWYGDHILALGDAHAALVSFSGPTAPGVLDGLDPVRAGRDRLPMVKEVTEVINRNVCNWSVVPGPNPAWAQLVHPDLDPDGALERLWQQIEHVCRLDEPDPVAAWRDRMAALEAVAARLTAAGLDALHYEGPGIDLTAGLLPGATWITGAMHTDAGIPHLANIPTEEVFTSPDPARVDGTVTSTRPLVLPDGTVVRDLVMRFERGRAVQVEASVAGETLRTLMEADEGAVRLGELALVDRDGRIGTLDTTFYDTLLDENAASHIALGAGFPSVVKDGDVNDSAIHIDFMIGSPEVRVTGITASGDRVPVLAGGSWQL